MLEVYDNGTMKIQKGAITDTINIRRVTPFHESHDQDHGGACNEQTCARPDKISSSVLKPRRRSDRLSRQVIR